MCVWSGGVQQVFHELAAQVHVHLLKGAFAVYKPLKVLIDVLPLDIPPVCQFLEVGEEIPFILALSKKPLFSLKMASATPVAEYLRLFIMRALKSRSCWLAGLAKCKYPELHVLSLSWWCCHGSRDNSPDTDEYCVPFLILRLRKLLSCIYSY